MVPEVLSPPTEKAFRIQVVTTPSELECIQKFRYQVCAVEHGQTHLEGTCHHSRTIADPLDHDLTVFSISRHGQLVGTLRWGLVSWTQRPHRHTLKLRALGFENPSELGVTDRLALAPGVRSLATLRRIYEAVATRALEAGSVYEFCWAKPKLAALYALLGYHRTGAQLINGAGTPLEILQLNLRPDLSSSANPAAFGGSFAFPFTPQAA